MVTGPPSRTSRVTRLPSRSSHAQERLAVGLDHLDDSGLAVPHHCAVIGCQSDPVSGGCDGKPAAFLG